MTYDSATEADHYWDQAPLGHISGYQDRARAVYWDKTFPACRAKGRGHAECLLNPGHEGDHYGNGFDDFGPRGATRWRQRPDRVLPDG